MILFDAVFAGCKDYTIFRKHPILFYLHLFCFSCYQVLFNVNKPLTLGKSSGYISDIDKNDKVSDIKYKNLSILLDIKISIDGEIVV